MSIRTAHASQLLHAVQSLRDAGFLTDVTLICSGHMIKAHRLVLAAHSRYFYSTFISPSNPPQTILLDDLGITAKQMLQLVDFMYTGEAEFLTGVEAEAEQLGIEVIMQNSLCVSINRDSDEKENIPLHGDADRTTETITDGQQTGQVKENSPAAVLMKWLKYYKFSEVTDTNSDTSEAEEVAKNGKKRDVNRTLTKRKCYDNNKTTAANKKRKVTGLKKKEKKMPKHGVKATSKSEQSMNNDKDISNPVCDEAGDNNQPLTGKKSSQLQKNVSKAKSGPVQKIHKKHKYKYKKTKTGRYKKKSKPVKINKENIVNNTFLNSEGEGWESDPKKIDENGVEGTCNLNENQVESLSSGGYLCKICDFYCDSSNEMIKHGLDEHRHKRKAKSQLNLKNNTLCDTEVRPYSCQKCSSRFKTIKYCQRHEKSHKKNHSVKKCSLCNATFLSARFLSYHMNNAHESFPCEYEGCSHKAPSILWLRRHINRAHGITPVKGVNQCDICGALLSSRQSLVNHRLLHSGARRQCKHCDYSSGSLHVLRNHCKKRHNVDLNNKPVTPKYNCKQCKYSTFLRSDIKRHMLQHEESTPYRCPLCDFATTDKTTLKKHSRMHKAERPFNCGICKKAFKQKSTVQRHRQMHLGLKPFQCTMCPNVYADKKSLKAHLCVHTGTKPYNCQLCPFGCTTKYKLQQHTKNIHFPSDDPVKKNHKQSKKKPSTLVRTQPAQDAIETSPISHAAVKDANITYTHSHTSNKPFCCAHCSYGCTKRYLLQNHINKVHFPSKVVKETNANSEVDAKENEPLAAANVVTDEIGILRLANKLEDSLYSVDREDTPSEDFTGEPTSYYVPEHKYGDYAVNTADFIDPSMGGMQGRPDEVGLLTSNFLSVLNSVDQNLTKTDRLPAINTILHPEETYHSSYYMGINSEETVQTEPQNNQQIYLKSE